jgi:hypothetical protein
MPSVGVGGGYLPGGTTMDFLLIPMISALSLMLMCALVRSVRTLLFLFDVVCLYHDVDDVG